MNISISYQSTKQGAGGNPCSKCQLLYQGAILYTALVSSMLVPSTSFEYIECCLSQYALVKRTLDKWLRRHFDQLLANSFTDYLGGSKVKSFWLEKLKLEMDILALLRGEQGDCSRRNIIH